MNVRQIVEQWLRANGYDGLSGLDCCCEVNDLMPCGEYVDGCEAGYKVPCPGAEDCAADGDCPWHINTSKPKGVKDDKEEKRN